jgi:hypothetical protein
MRLLFFVLGILCFAVLVAGEALPVRARIVDAGGGLLGFVTFFATETENLEKATRGICHFTLFVGVITPFLFLFKAHGLAKAASVILGVALSLAFLDNLSVVSDRALGPWQAQALPWLLMLAACVGYYFLAVFATKSYEDDAPSFDAGRRWTAVKFIRVAIAIGLVLIALELGREGLDAVSRSSQVDGAAADIMIRHYHSEAFGAFGMGFLFACTFRDLIHAMPPS